MKDRVILHSDLNNFYASVECLENPELAGFAVAVCGDKEERRGIILAKNEKAKAFGVKTGEPIFKAQQKCENLKLVPPNHEKYKRYSERVLNIYNSYTDQVEPFGIDEAWLDVTGEDGVLTAERIRARIKSEIGLTVSIGVSWNKVFAKLASDLKKPDAVTAITRENFKSVVFPLHCQNLLFVGEKTAAALEKYSIYTIGDIANTEVGFLRRVFGKAGEQMYIYANGLDNSSVSRLFSYSPPKSVSNSATTKKDLKTESDIIRAVSGICEKVAERLQRKGLVGTTVHLMLKDNNFTVWKKQTSFERPTNLLKHIIKACRQIFLSYQIENPIRSVGVGVTNLRSITGPVQLDIFSYHQTQKDERAEEAVKQIKEKYGKAAIKKGD